MQTLVFLTYFFSKVIQKARLPLFGKGKVNTIQLVTES